jgi:hypothetical protein
VSRPDGRLALAPGGGAGGLSGSVGSGSGGTSAGTGGAGTGAGGLVNSTLGSGSPITSFDPLIFVNPYGPGLVFFPLALMGELLATLAEIDRVAKKNGFIENKVKSA